MATHGLANSCALGFLVLVALGTGGCMSLSSRPSVTNQRAVSDEISDPLLGRPPVVDWQAACDTIARDLVLASVFQTATRPQVVEIKPIENQTGVDIDCKIYPETIRAKIVESGNSRIAFRDEAAASQIVDERASQSGDPVVVDRASTQKARTRKRVGPASDGLPLEESEILETKTVRATSSVSGLVAAADLFLNGKVYAENEQTAGNQQRGYRYYQFQFRLSDARTGLIKWEKSYRVKREGALSSASFR